MRMCLNYPSVSFFTESRVPNGPIPCDPKANQKKNAPCDAPRENKTRYGKEGIDASTDDGNDA